MRVTGILYRIAYPPSNSFVTNIPSSIQLSMHGSRNNSGAARSSLKAAVVAEGGREEATAAAVTGDGFAATEYRPPNGFEATEYSAEEADGTTVAEGPLAGWWWSGGCGIVVAGGSVRGT